MRGSPTAPKPSAARSLSRSPSARLRYFMLKFHSAGSVIAFDFKDALSFEGETGPYVQYAIVRIRNILSEGWNHAGSGVSGVRSAWRRRTLDLLRDADEIWAIWLHEVRSVPRSSPVYYHL